MKTLVLIVAAVIAVGALLAFARLSQLWSEQRRPHDPIEYYGSWDGYGLPLHLTHRIAREEAEARAARGSPYLIGHFDAQGRLIRAVKLLRQRLLRPGIFL